MEEKKTELKMIKMSEVQSQEIEWLRYPFIPYGKLTIVQCDREAERQPCIKYCSQVIQGRGTG